MKERELLFDTLKESISSLSDKDLKQVQDFVSELKKQNGSIYQIK